MTASGSTSPCKARLVSCWYAVYKHVYVCVFVGVCVCVCVRALAAAPALAKHQPLQGTPGVMLVRCVQTCVCMCVFVLCVCVCLCVCIRELHPVRASHLSSKFGFARRKSVVSTERGPGIQGPGWGRRRSGGLPCPREEPKSSSRGVAGRADPCL